MSRRNSLFYRLFAVMAAAFVLAACGSTSDTTATRLGALTISNPWLRPAQHDSNGVSYMTISSSGEADRLLMISTDVAEAIELHATMSSNDIMSMQPVEGGIAIPAEGSVELKSGGFHAMLIGLKKDLRVGETVDLQLTFERAGKVAVKAQVRER